MKKRLIFLVVFFIIFFSNLPYAKAEDLKLSAKSSVLICADSGCVLFSKNDLEKLPMASTTKIMTALLTIEKSQAENKQIEITQEKFQSENKQVEITQEMVMVEGSSMGLKAGDVVTLDTLAKGMLTRSGNDAANAAAIAIAGSKDDFAILMNQRAKQIGMTNTNFVTPSGLDDENHYSTAYDMAILGAYAMENQAFADIASQKCVTVDFINPAIRRSYRNHNRLITLYRGCIGIKTGFTKKAGRCLVSCAERDGVRLVAVTLNAPDDWNDHMNMYDYGFCVAGHVVLDDTNLSYTEPVVGADVGNIPINAAFSVGATLRKSNIDRITKRIDIEPFLYAPIEKGQIVGKIYYELDGEPIASTDLISGEQVEKKGPKNFFKWVNKIFSF